MIQTRCISLCISNVWIFNSNEMILGLNLFDSEHILNLFNILVSIVNHFGTRKIRLIRSNNQYKNILTLYSWIDIGRLILTWSSLLWSIPIWQRLSLWWSGSNWYYWWLVWRTPGLTWWPLIYRSWTIYCNK